MSEGRQSKIMSCSGRTAQIRASVATGGLDIYVGLSIFNDDELHRPNTITTLRVYD